jgi:large subunit ribosomal protein L18
MAFVRGKSRSAARDRRHTRLRKKIVGTATKPRLVVTRSARHLFVQVVDDAIGHTVASASTMETEKAKSIGKLIAERAKKAGVASVVFDRGGNRYAGRVAAVAESARESGLEL